MNAIGIMIMGALSGADLVGIGLSSDLRSDMS